MTQKLEFDIFEIKQLQENINTLIINKITNKNIKTFNKLMEIFEQKPRRGILFVCNQDYSNNVIFQHLALFALHFKLISFGMCKGSRHKIEKTMNCHYVSLVFIDESDSNYLDVLNIIKNNSLID